VLFRSRNRVDATFATLAVPIRFSLRRQFLDVGDSEELTAQAETDWYGESGECGIDAIPTPLRDALADAGDLVQVAERWTATDELQLSGWSVDETHEVLRSLARLAVNARASGRDLWFYWSL